MKHNGRAPIALSSMKNVNQYSVTGTVRPTVVCQDCGTHRILTRGMIHPHRADNGARCPGSAQRIVVDVVPGAWAIAYAEACETTEIRRAKRTMIKPLLPVATPVHRIAAAR